MKKYKVICIDLFETLVNISDRTQTIWKRILKEDYSDTLYDKYSTMVQKELVYRFHEVHSMSTNFSTLRSIFEEGFKDIFEDQGLNHDPKEAAQIFIEEHKLADWYGDSMSFLTKAQDDHKVCLVSDADLDMVSATVEDFKFDKIVISEDMKSYKRNGNGKMFKEVLEHFEVLPSEVLHIGDSASDIAGAQAIGIDTCWINRSASPRRFNIKPTYNVVSLTELEHSVLKVNPKK